MRGLLTVALSIFFISCGSSERRDYEKGISKVESKDYKAAINYFEQSVLRNPDSQYAILAAKEGAKIAYYELKDFAKANSFLKQLVINSTSADDRILAQRQLVSIYFDNLNDYKNAIAEINRFLPMVQDQEEKEKLRQNLARSYYYINNFTQAQSEAEELIKNGKNSEIKFQMMVLKGNIFLANKDINQAAAIFHEILKKYPDRAVKENIASTLAVAYEEMKDYKSAIQVLESMRPFHPLPEYIDLRIKRLTQNQKNQPGAKGLRRK